MREGARVWLSPRSPSYPNSARRKLRSSQAAAIRTNSGLWIKTYCLTMRLDKTTLRSLVQLSQVRFRSEAIPHTLRLLRAATARPSSTSRLMTRIKIRESSSTQTNSITAMIQMAAREPSLTIELCRGRVEKTWHKSAKITRIRISSSITKYMVLRICKILMPSASVTLSIASWRMRSIRISWRDLTCPSRQSVVQLYLAEGPRSTQVSVRALAVLPAYIDQQSKLPSPAMAQLPLMLDLQSNSILMRWPPPSSRSVRWATFHSLPTTEVGLMMLATAMTLWLRHPSLGRPLLLCTDQTTTFTSKHQARLTHSRCFFSIRGLFISRFTSTKYPFL